MCKNCIHGINSWENGAGFYMFIFFNRAEALAIEIKDLQGQLADYNMVSGFAIVEKCRVICYI